LQRTESAAGEFCALRKAVIRGSIAVGGVHDAREHLWHTAGAGSRWRGCPKEVQQGFVFGQRDHHLCMK
jgi:hypothetical protein